VRVLPIFLINTGGPSHEIWSRITLYTSQGKMVVPVTASRNLILYIGYLSEPSPVLTGDMP
jgi:hypothetical protein